MGKSLEESSETGAAGNLRKERGEQGEEREEETLQGLQQEDKERGCMRVHSRFRQVRRWGSRQTAQQESMRERLLIDRQMWCMLQLAVQRDQPLHMGPSCCCWTQQPHWLVHQCLFARLISPVLAVLLLLTVLVQYRIHQYLDSSSATSRAPARNWRMKKPKSGVRSIDPSSGGTKPLNSLR